MSDPHRGQPPHDDPFIEEVRALKRAAWEDAGGDLQKLAEQLREIQQRHKDRVVPRPSNAKSEDAA